MLTLNETEQKQLVQLFDTLIEEAMNDKLLIRGHKRSTDNGLSWLKTDRIAVLEKARAMLTGAQDAAEDQPSQSRPKTRIRSKADADQE